MRLTIFHEILHSEQFEDAEFIDRNSFLWLLTPVNICTRHLIGHSFRRRTANATISMKFRTPIPRSPFPIPYSPFPFLKIAIDLCYIKSSFQIYQLSFLNKKLIEVFVYILN